MSGPKTTTSRRKPAVSIALLGAMAAFVVVGAMDLWSLWLGVGRAAGITLSILLVAALLWMTELVPLFVTSFVILAANVLWLEPSLAESKGAEPFMMPFFSNIILLFLGGFVLSAGLNKYTLDERLAQWVLERTGDRPARVLLGIMLVTAFLSMWMSNTATTAMMLALALPLLENVDRSDPYRRAVLLGIPFAANLGGLGTPIGTPPNAIALSRMAEEGIAPSFAQWMLLAFPVLVVALAILWRMLLVLCPPRVERVVLSSGQTFRWTRRSRLVAVVTIVTALGWLTGDVHGVASGIVALVPVVVMFGLRLLSINDFRGLSWDVLFIVGGGMSLGVAVQTSGLSSWLVGLIPTEGIPVVALVVIFAVATAILSSVMSNTATANLLVPVVIGLGMTLAPPLLMAVAYACSMAMALPVSTPPNAMVFSSGEIEVRDMLKPGLLMTVIGLALTCTLGYGWWGVLGLR